jgi:hypothetical protein
MLGLAACYSPRPSTGAPCPDGVCPAGLICASATQTCELTDLDAAPPRDNCGATAVACGGDADMDAPPVCFGAGLSTICFDTPPAAPLTIEAATLIDTDASPACLPYTGTHPGQLCVIAGTAVTVASPLAAHGSRPLVLLATDALAIASLVDVASHRALGLRGAGAHPATCGPPEAAGEGEGGAGGSFGGRGGTGGVGEGPPPGPAAAAPGATPTTLRGGCRGGNGSSGGDGGDGGGALYLIAGASITIEGALNASGAGGTRSTTNDEGGGGGGSGGMIALEAPSVVVTGQVFANGGGGAAGNESSEHGGEATSAQVPARGGKDLDHTGDGGDGAAGTALGGKDGFEGTDGGGGGGGGAGVIRVFPAQPLGGAVSPPPT